MLYWSLLKLQLWYLSLICSPILISAYEKHTQTWTFWFWTLWSCFFKQNKILFFCYYLLLLHRVASVSHADHLNITSTSSDMTTIPSFVKPNVYHSGTVYQYSKNVLSIVWTTISSFGRNIYSFVICMLYLFCVDCCTLYYNSMLQTRHDSQSRTNNF